MCCRRFNENSCGDRSRSTAYLTPPVIVRSVFHGDGPNVFDKPERSTGGWKEGKAPESIVASHSTDGKVDRTRPLCPYPQVAKYKGTGSIDSAANFTCSLALRRGSLALSR
jgi:hypothetical protein